MNHMAFIKELFVYTYQCYFFAKKKMNLFEVYNLCRDEENAVAFLQEKRLIPKVRVCSEGHFMNCDARSGKWTCHKRSCRTKKGLCVDTWFENARLPLNKAVLLIYCWSQEYTSTKFCTKELNISTNTITDWKNMLREICANSLLKTPAVIGGENLTVEINESCFSRRKANVGRIYPKQWVFGGICRETRECFIYFVPDRTSATLLECIRCCIRPGTTIISDCWASYQGLEEKLPELRYRHLTVNHSENFVDPNTGAYTQTIESLWARAKSRNRKECGTRRTLIDSYLCEFLWRQRNKDKDFFEQILKDMAEIVLN